MLSLNCGRNEEPWVLCRDPKTATQRDTSLIEFEFLNPNDRGRVIVNYAGPLTILRPDVAHRGTYERLSDIVYDEKGLNDSEAHEELIEGSGLPLILSPFADRNGTPVTHESAISLILLGKKIGKLRDKFRVNYVGPLSVWTYEQVLDSGNFKFIDTVRGLAQSVVNGLRRAA